MNAAFECSQRVFKCIIKGISPSTKQLTEHRSHAGDVILIGGVNLDQWRYVAAPLLMFMINVWGPRLDVGQYLFSNRQGIVIIFYLKAVGLFLLVIRADISVPVVIASQFVGNFMFNVFCGEDVFKWRRTYKLNIIKKCKLVPPIYSYMLRTGPILSIGVDQWTLFTWISPRPSIVFPSIDLIMKLDQVVFFCDELKYS